MFEWQTAVQLVAAMGVQINQKIAAGQLYRLVSCTFLHGGLFHLLCNCKVPFSSLPLPTLLGPASCYSFPTSSRSPRDQPQRLRLNQWQLLT